MSGITHYLPHLQRHTDILHPLILHLLEQEYASRGRPATSE